MADRRRKLPALAFTALLVSPMAGWISLSERGWWGLVEWPFLAAMFTLYAHIKDERSS